MIQPFPNRRGDDSMDFLRITGEPAALSGAQTLGEYYLTRRQEGITVGRLRTRLAWNLDENWPFQFATVAYLSSRCRPFGVVDREVDRYSYASRYRNWPARTRRSRSRASTPD